MFGCVATHTHTHQLWANARTAFSAPTKSCVGQKTWHASTYGWPYTHVVVFNKDFPVLFIDTQNSLPISSFLFCYCQAWMLFSHLFSYLVHCTAFVCTAIIISYNTFNMFRANRSVFNSLERWRIRFYVCCRWLFQLTILSMAMFHIESCSFYQSIGYCRIKRESSS